MKEIKNSWDKRYKVKHYQYGVIPNLFFKNFIDNLSSKSKILLPGEGEGRNGVYAAKKGHSILAFDQSEEGRKKALSLAKKEGVKIEYLVGEFDQLELNSKKFDIAAFIYIHPLPDIRRDLHRNIGKLIKKDGYIILEGFSVNNLKYRDSNNKVGGPKRGEMLFTKEMIIEDFNQFDIVKIEEIEIELNEGVLHNGLGKIIRFIGKKRG